ncbi:MAG: TonB-dependent receptor plug domain-containing protein [Muribaculaceae bacterium]|nr:TonB-dependent receptor plug domain-containing protein [Muribaculaceae bacterium]
MKRIIGITAGWFLFLGPCLANNSSDNLQLETDTFKTVPSYNLDEVIIIATGADRNLNAAEMGRHVIGSEAIMKLPVLLGEPDIIKSLQTLPGVAQGVEGFTGLYVHGGENDQNLFLYNGLPLYHVAHLGGIFSAFNVSTVNKVDFYKSAFPARYGGRISSITDIKMNDPEFNKYTGKFTIGLLAANAYISGPIVKDKLAFSAGLRRSWVDIVGLPALAVVNAIQKKNGKKTIVNYNFTDFNARIDWKVGNGKIYAIGYYGRDYLKIGLREFESNNKFSYVINPDTGQYEPDNSGDESTTKYYDENTNRLSWGNWGVSLNADYRVGGGYVNAITYYSKYSSRYRQLNEHQNDLEDPDTYGRTYDETSNAIGDFGFNLQFTRQWRQTWLLRAGAEYVFHNYHPEGLINEFLDDRNHWIEDNGNPSVKANEVSVYIDNLFNFGERASLDIGLRFADYFIKGNSFPRLEPRVSLRISLDDNYSIKASYARINQFVQQVSPNYINLPTDLWQPVGLGKKPLSSDQYSIGFYGNLPKGMYFSVEGWYKSMRNLVEYREGISMLNPNLSWNEKTVSGKGWTYGVDLSITKEIGKVTGSVSYGLMWNWRKFDELNGGNKFPAKFDNRNKININASYKLNDKIEFNAGWTYMTGNRITMSLYEYESAGAEYDDAPGIVGDKASREGYDNLQSSPGIGYISNRNNIRLPAYHQLDLGMSLYRNLKNGGRTIWNFSLYNAYCHMNAVTIVKSGYGSAYAKHKKFQTLSLLPIIPSVSWTYEF